MDSQEIINRLKGLFKFTEIKSLNNVNNEKYHELGNIRKNELKELLKFDIPLSELNLGKMTSSQYEEYKIKMKELSNKAKLAIDRENEIKSFFPEDNSHTKKNFGEISEETYSNFKETLILGRERRNELIALFSATPIGYSIFDLGTISLEEYEKLKKENLEATEYKKSLFFNIIEEIKAFEPPKKYETEEGYHGTLYTWLKAKYPNAQYEHRKGYTRPDIVIDNIAIEIKGPTVKRDLDTIPNKCMEYRIHYTDFIVVLFDVRIDEMRFRDWYDNILDLHEKNFKHFKIVRK